MSEDAKAEKAPKEEKKAVDAAVQTPSALAAQEAGNLDDNASDEDKVAWNDRYLAAKLRARRG